MNTQALNKQALNKHETDVFSLVFGVVFLVIVASWGIAKMVEIAWFSIGWVFAGGMILIGLFGILSAIRPSRNP